MPKKQWTSLYFLVKLNHEKRKKKEKESKKRKKKGAYKNIMPRGEILFSRDIVYHTDSKMPAIVKHTIVLSTTRKGKMLPW